MSAPKPENEEIRLVDLQEHQILDTPQSEDFDGLVRIAALICGVPIAACTLIDRDRQWFKSITGLSISETPRDISFCAHTILEQQIFVVPDATKDVRFTESPLVKGELGVRFYAGIPLFSHKGNALGTLCVIDMKPRQLTGDQIEALRILGLQAASLLDSWRKTAEIEMLAAKGKLAEATLAESETRMRRLSDASFEAIAVTQNGMFIDGNTALVDTFGFDSVAQMQGLSGLEIVAAESRHLVSRKITECDEEPYEAVLQRRDGSTFIAEIRGRLVSMNGTPTRLTAIRNISRLKDMERELRERDAKMRVLLESAPIILFTVNSLGIVTFSEGKGLAAIGLVPGEAVGQSVFDFTMDDKFSAENTRKALLGEAVSHDSHYASLVLHTELRPMFNADGSPNGYIGVCFDVTERVLSEQRFRVLFKQSPYPHVIYDEADQIVECNTATLAMMRCDKSQLIGKHPGTLSPRRQPDGRLSSEKSAEMCALARRNGRHTFEWRRRAVDGHEFPVEVTLTPITLNNKSALLSVWNDLSERKRYEEDISAHAAALQLQKEELEKLNSALETLATTDGLTGLRNHLSFQERMSDEVSRAMRYGTPLSLIMLDVDRFKKFNDSSGHPAGDAVLKTVGALLQDAARETDVAARYGGEEFALILPMTGLQGAAFIAERLRAAIQDRPWTGRPVTASFGVSSFSFDCDTVEKMIVSADNALYKSKAAGRNTVSCDDGEQDTNCASVA